MTETSAAFWRGARHSLPFTIVVIPFAILFGVVATEAGLNVLETMVFTVTVFAGASQFAALQLMQDNAPTLIVLATALAVNLRMVMYSMTLAPHFGTLPMRSRALMAYFLVDQSFALSLAEFEKNRSLTVAEKVAYFFGTVTPITAIWNVSTAVGAHLGRAVPDTWGLDFAMPITFVGMTAAMLTTLPHAVAMAVSVGVTLMLWTMPYGTGLLVGAAVGMAAGAITEAWRDRA